MTAPTGPRPGPAWWAAVGAALLRRPSLWATAATQVLRLARPGWWRRTPFLPLPDADYLRFRWETQYGGEGEPDPHDVIVYLAWCREFGHLGPTP